MNKKLMQTVSILAPNDQFIPGGAQSVKAKSLMSRDGEDCSRFLVQPCRMQKESAICLPRQLGDGTLPFAIDGFHYDTDH